MHLHNPSDYPPPISLPLLFIIMARTSRDPFSPPSSSMKKKGGGRKKVAGESAKADGSAGTPKKKTTTSANQTKKKNPPELSNIEESPPINQRKAPPEDIMPSLVPDTRRNAVSSTRNGLPQPPAHVLLVAMIHSMYDPLFLLLTAIFILSTTLLPTNTHLHPSLRWQPVRHPHQPIPLKMTRMRRSTTY